MISRRSVLLLMQPWLVAIAAVRGNDAMYVGGTVGLPERTKGWLDTSADPKALLFWSKKGTFQIPYDGVTSLEYGQKAGRRLGVALAITVFALFSKKRKHFVTIGFKDAKDQPQGVVLELAKGKSKPLITLVEARSGVKCEYESEEARKYVHG